MKHLIKFNELNTQTYADILNKTETYPWVKFLGDKFKKADKMESVNKLAKEHFIKYFMNEFKEGIDYIEEYGGNIHAYEFKWSDKKAVPNGEVSIKYPLPAHEGQREVLPSTSVNICFP